MGDFDPVSVINASAENARKLQSCSFPCRCIDWRTPPVDFLGRYASPNGVSTTLDCQLARTAGAANGIANVIQLLATELGKNLPDAWRRNGHRPVVVESWEHAMRYDFTGFDLNQTCPGPKTVKRVQVSNFRMRWQDRLRPHAAHGNMDIFIREAASLNVPRICGDGAPGANDAAQLCDPFGGIWNEKNDKGHYADIEGGIGIGKLRCGTQGEVGHTRAVAVSGKLQLCL